MSTSSAPSLASKTLSPQLSLLVNSLTTVDQSTKQTQALLESFSQKHKSLATSIDSFNESIVVWKLMTVNVNETIEKIEEIRQRFVDVRSLSLQKPSIDLLDKIIELQAYFERHQSFQDVTSTLERLKELRLKSITYLEDTFKKKIAMDKVLEDKDVEIIAKRLHYLNVLSYRKTYVEVRRKILKVSLFGSNKTSSSDVMRKVTFGVASSTSHKLKGQGQNQSKDRFYKSGSHTFIKLIDDFIDGLKRERQILNMCIFENPPTSSKSKGSSFKSKTNISIQTPNENTSVVEDHRSVSQVFEDVVYKSKKRFFEKAASTGDDVKQSERVFVLLDVLNYYEKRMKDFDPVVTSEELVDFQKQLRMKISTHLKEYKDVILSMAKADTSEPGQVHQVTSNTFLLFHRLLRYTDTVNSLLEKEYFNDASIKDVKKRKIKSYFGKYMQSIMKEATDKAIEIISNQEKSKSVKLLFLLNNYQYILEKLQTEALGQHVNEAYVAEYDLRCKASAEEFLKTAWKPLEETLINLNEIEILKKGDKLTKKWKTAVKNRFKSFNSKLNAINTQHISFKVANAKIGTELRSSAEEMICDKYETFYNKYSVLPFSKKHTAKYLEFKPDTVRDIIRQLYK